ncbi:general secretion pathway protein GspB [Massilia sp. TS11]|uniref:general secretion pathway protein GspB n=1 Tax=Massilia sp. TS11 TaxID=2908003 RepID=UPI001EDB95A2|nr:general secretion pathway protein GspB [Massilia sp. TS11]MCG2584558.1 general secretion pathway protein GspB [Massilia sp. TS11]
MKRACLIAVWAVAAPLWAQSLPDPTLPPAAAMPTQPSDTPAAAMLQAAPALAEPQLQSILLGKKPGGRRLALIDGQLYKIGDKMRDMELVSIDENRVILRQGKTTKVLKLYGSNGAAGAETAQNGVTK